MVLAGRASIDAEEREVPNLVKLNKGDSMYKITHKIPDSKHHRYEFWDEIPWLDLNVGDSITIPRSHLTLHNIEAVRAAIYKHARRLKYHMGTMITDDRCLTIWKKD
jgi:hypothetical protein